MCVHPVSLGCGIVGRVIPVRHRRDLLLPSHIDPQCSRVLIVTVCSNPSHTSDQRTRCRRPGSVVGDTLPSLIMCSGIQPLSWS